MLQRKFFSTASSSIACDRPREGCVDFAARGEQSTSLLIEANRCNFTTWLNKVRFELFVKIKYQSCIFTQERTAEEERVGISEVSLFFVSLRLALLLG